MFVHHTWSTRCCFHGWRNGQATWATPQFQQWDTSRSLWLTWREPATMQLCFNNLMEDKACTSRPMTNTGFWSPFQTVTGAVTNDMDAPHPQVSIWYVVIWFTQAHVPKGWFLFQAAKLNYMEWFPPFVTASSSNVVLNLWSRAMSSAFCWLTLPVHARAQGRWSTWVPKYTLDTGSSSKWGDCFESNQHSLQCCWYRHQGVVCKTPEDSSQGHWHLWR